MADFQNEKMEKLTERWLRGDKSLSIEDRISVLEKLVRRLLWMQKAKKRKEEKGG